jgi:glycosyl transferase family 25
MNMRVVVINLENEKHRLARISRLSEEAGFGFERIDAVDGRDPKHTDLIQKHRKRRLFRPAVPDTDIACALSHRKAWQSLLDSDEKWLAVFEDDVHFGHGIASLFDESWIPAAVELVKLETFLSRGRIAVEPLATFQDRKLYRLGGSNLGTGGYLISRSAAKRMLRLTESIKIPVDSIMFDRRGGLMQQIAIHQLVPAACVQELYLARHQKRSNDLPTTMIRPRLSAAPRLQRIARRVCRVPSRIWAVLPFRRPKQEPMREEAPIPFA